MHFGLYVGKIVRRVALICGNDSHVNGNLLALRKLLVGTFGQFRTLRFSGMMSQSWFFTTAGNNAIIINDHLILF